jgi:hypothetical protein
MSAVLGGRRGHLLSSYAAIRLACAVSGAISAGSSESHSCSTSAREPAPYRYQSGSRWHPLHGLRVDLVILGMAPEEFSADSSHMRVWRNFALSPCGRGHDRYCAHEEWVRGFFAKRLIAKRPPHPSYIFAIPSCPLPQGERATARTGVRHYECHPSKSVHERNMSQRPPCR